MAEHELIRTAELPRPIAEVFAFFADAENLETITPPELNFQIVTLRPIDIREGALIDYKLRLRGVPISWRTEISVWDPPFKFVDRQLRGPYAKWVHTHTFEAVGPELTRMADRVIYELPFGPIGDLAHFIVERELRYIFDYRQKKIADLLG